MITPVVKMISVNKAAVIATFAGISGVIVGTLATWRAFKDAERAHARSTQKTNTPKDEPVLEVVK